MMIMYKGQDTIDHWLEITSAERSFVMDPHFQQSLQGVMHLENVGSSTSSELL